MRIFKTLAAAQALLKSEELACLLEEGPASFVYRDDTGAVLLLGTGNLRYRSAWNGSDYRKGDLVTYDGRAFVAKAGMSSSGSVEPGSTVGWESYWDALSS